MILTDSWLMPGRYGTTGVAIAMAGFQPIKDERGKQDLFGNAMAVTQVRRGRFAGGMRASGSWESETKRRPSRLCAAPKLS